MMAALLLFLLLPSAGTELSELHPAAMLYVSMDEKIVCVQTDTNDAGRGETLDAALRNMRNTSTRVIRLDTVEGLLITESAGYLLSDLKEIIRPTARVCMASGEQDMQIAGEYMQTHIPTKKLSDVADVSELQYLSYREGRYHLEHGRNSG